MLELTETAQLRARVVSLEALRQIISEDAIGEETGVDVVDPRTFTLFFASQLAGYTGWNWAVTVTQVSDDDDVTVVELGQVPGEDALVALKWVPWAERLKQYREAKAREEAAEAAAAEAALKELGDDDEAADDLLDNDHSDFDDDLDGVDFELDGVDFELGDDDDSDDDDDDDDVDVDEDDDDAWAEDPWADDEEE